jgi:hypothetical protein
VLRPETRDWPDDEAWGISLVTGKVTDAPMYLQVTVSKLELQERSRDWVGARELLRALSVL